MTVGLNVNLNILQDVFLPHFNMIIKCFGEDYIGYVHVVTQRWDIIKTGSKEGEIKLV